MKTRISALSEQKQTGSTRLRTDLIKVDYGDGFLFLFFFCGVLKSHTHTQQHTHRQPTVQLVSSGRRREEEEEEGGREEEKEEEEGDK